MNFIKSVFIALFLCILIVLASMAIGYGYTVGVQQAASW